MDASASVASRHSANAERRAAEDKIKGDMFREPRRLKPPTNADVSDHDHTYAQPQEGPGKNGGAHTAISSRQTMHMLSQASLVGASYGAPAGLDPANILKSAPHRLDRNIRLLRRGQADHQVHWRSGNCIRPDYRLLTQLEPSPADERLRSSRPTRPPRPSWRDRAAQDARSHDAPSPTAKPHSPGQNPGISSPIPRSVNWGRRQWVTPFRPGRLRTDFIPRLHQVPSTLTVSLSGT